MPIDRRILECESEYIKCFCEIYENENIIRFRDNELKDMYYHNYTYIKEEKSYFDLAGIIYNEISLSLSEGSSFCNILMNFPAGDSLVSMLEYKPEISSNGYYLFDISIFPGLKALPGCTVKRVSSQEMVDDILYCDLQHDENTLGRDFCTRRCYRRGKVYLSDEGVNSYVCYDNGERVGSCDLFIHNGTAKIEDFAVMPSRQRKRYGRTILKHLIDTAIKAGCHTIYLVTGEDDTAKEMYKKIGFSKIGERTDLFFRLK